MSVVLENLEILQRLNGLKTEKYYVIGNHDYSFSILTRAENEGKLPSKIIQTSEELPSK